MEKEVDKKSTFGILACISVVLGILYFFDFGGYDGHSSGGVVGMYFGTMISFFTSVFIILGLFFDPKIKYSVSASILFILEIFFFRTEIWNGYKTFLF